MTAATKATFNPSKTFSSPAGDLPWECGRKGGRGELSQEWVSFFELWPLLPPFPRKTAEEEEEKGGGGKNDARCPGKKKCRRFIYMADGGLGKAQVVLCWGFFYEKRVFLFCILRTRRSECIFILNPLSSQTKLSVFPKKIQFPNLTLFWHDVKIRDTKYMAFSSSDFMV